jgi:Na+/proline symporter
MVGIIVCGGVALKMVGWAAAVDAVGPDRLKILDFGHWGFRAGGEYGFWPMTIGGIFLYASYYGCDQSQVQRELSVGSLRDVKRSLLFNAFGRFPVVLLYCAMGVAIGAIFAMPEHFSHLASRLGVDAAVLKQTVRDDPDRMVPMFVLAFLPAGVVGLVFVAIMSALMSSLDSAINSLSAVTMEDFYRPYVKPDATEGHYIVVSKALTAIWGVFCIVAALVFAHSAEATRQTTIVLINAVGSLLYGPILAAFLIGISTRAISGFQVKTGIAFGIAVNVVLWRLTDVSWLWWNFAGFLVTALVALAAYGARSWLGRRPADGLFQPRAGAVERVGPLAVATIGYTILIVALAYAIQSTG